VVTILGFVLVVAGVCFVLFLAVGALAEGIESEDRNKRIAGIAVAVATVAAIVWALMR
jgi:hypothetical protein